jgi:hypothetical protein
MMSFIRVCTYVCIIRWFEIFPLWRHPCICEWRMKNPCSNVQKDQVFFFFFVWYTWTTRYWFHTTMSSANDRICPSTSYTYRFWWVYSNSFCFYFNIIQMTIIRFFFRHHHHLSSTLSLLLFCSPCLIHLDTYKICICDRCLSDIKRQIGIRVKEGNRSYINKSNYMCFFVFFSCVRAYRKKQASITLINMCILVSNNTTRYMSVSRL